MSDDGIYTGRWHSHLLIAETCKALANEEINGHRLRRMGCDCKGATCQRPKLLNGWGLGGVRSPQGSRTLCDGYTQIYAGHKYLYKLYRYTNEKGVWCNMYMTCTIYNILVIYAEVHVSELNRAQRFLLYT